MDGNISYSVKEITPERTQKEIQKALFCFRHDGDDFFDEFIKNGGAGRDEETIAFLAGKMGMPTLAAALSKTSKFGCSAVSVPGAKGRFFGRNFDWYNCDALILENHPTIGYASISTVNLNFITDAFGEAASAIPEDFLNIAAVYSPLDGMNEKGVCICVNMIDDDAVFNQDTGKIKLTLTSAIRYVLNRAATTKEAVELIKNSDMQTSMGMMFHLMISDADGESVVLEFINNELVVTPTNVVTNFYLSPGEKYGIGTAQSHFRYDTLMDFVNDSASASNKVTEEDVARALSDVSKRNYEYDGETTEWSIVFDKHNLTALYFRSEDYTRAFRVSLGSQF